MFYVPDHLRVIFQNILPVIVWQVSTIKIYDYVKKRTLTKLPSRVFAQVKDNLMYTNIPEAEELIEIITGPTFKVK